jgi:hypothetical protein
LYQEKIWQPRVAGGDDATGPRRQASIGFVWTCSDTFFYTIRLPTVNYSCRLLSLTTAALFVCFLGDKSSVKFSKEEGKAHLVAKLGPIL